MEERCCHHDSLSGSDDDDSASTSDRGIIVAWYVSNGAQPRFPYHGFILANGVLQDGRLPQDSRTSLNDINGSGVIVGTHTNSSTGTSGGFLYIKGTVKDITGPNVQVSSADGINGYGYVTGSSSGGSFIAHCQ